MKNKKGVITVIEMSLLVLMFVSTSYYLVSNPSFDYHHQEGLDSMLDAIYQSSNYTDLFILENLSEFFPSQNYGELSAILNKSFREYELIISNTTFSKKIYVCEAKYSKSISERIVTIHNNTEYEFRKVTLGVCF